LFEWIYIHVMNLSGIDLNLLVALDALVGTSSVTKAARQNGITQPAMSNALRRLRDVCGDPILVKHGRSLVPTPWARDVRPVLARALGDLDAALSTGRSFDPSGAKAAMTIAMSDYWQFSLLPRLLERLGSEAPGLRLRVTPTSERALSRELPAGEVDAAIFLAPRSLTGIRCDAFVTDSYVCALRRGHRVKRGGLTLERYASCRHVVVSPRGPWEQRLDEALRRRGLTLELALETPHIQVALDIVGRTDFVAIIPQRVAQQERRGRSLKLISPPVPLGEFSLGLYWHDSTDSNPLHRWFRRLVIEEARSTYYGRPIA
jgi:DNA-binding transcriptional LysR family regulator